jgi:protocatechuate 3,4-dioxygenase beta subunit
VLFLIGLSDAPRRDASRGTTGASLQLVRVPVEVLVRPALPADVRFFRERDGSYEYVAHVPVGAAGEGVVQLPLGRYWVVARAPGRARVAVPAEVRSPERIVLELPEAKRLVVRVQSGKEPVAGAAVLVTGADALPLAATTDAAGQAVVDALSGEAWGVRVVARGYEPYETSTPGPELDVTLRRALALRVVVTDADGTRVPGAEVQLSGPELWPTRRVDTNTQGEVTISGLASGSYDVFARAGSRLSDTLRAFELRHEDGLGPRVVTLVLREGRFLAVRVVDAEARPVPDADLVLAEAGVAAFPLAARSDQHGQARLGPLRWQQAHLAVRADGFVPRSLWVGGESGGAGEPIEVVLVRGGTIVGRVVDERGFPVEGVSLEVIGTDLYGMPVALTPETSTVRKAHFAQVLQGPAALVPAGELGVMPGPVPPIPLAGSAAASLGMGLVAPGSWTTDDAGRFTARGVSPGELRILARHPEYVESVSDPVRLGAGGQAEVEVVLRAGRRLEGRLLDAQGFPVAQARLRIQAGRGAFDRTLLTRTDGTFVVAAAPKDLVVSVFGVDDPLRVVLRRAVALSDDPSERLDLELPEERPDVRLQVVDERGDPIAVAQVTLVSLDPEVPLRETRFSAEDGTLEVTAAAGVHGRVLVDAPGYARLDKVWDELPETARLELSRATSVTGRVTAVRGRQPASGARVVLRGEGLRRETRTNDSGEYTLRDVPPGKFTLSFEHAELGRAAVDVQVVRQDRDRPFEAPLVDLAEPAVLSGRVVDGAGQPVEGARVAVGVVPSYLPQGALPAGVVVTNGAGEFRLEGVDPGARTLSAHASGLGRGTLRLTALTPGGEQRDLVVRLTEPAGEDGHDWRGGVAVTLGERDHAQGTSVVVVHVAEGSEAERAGLQPGDVLTEVDGVAVSAMADARARLGGPAGSDVVLGFVRGGAAQRVRVTRESLSR